MKLILKHTKIHIGTFLDDTCKIRSFSAIHVALGFEARDLEVTIGSDDEDVALHVCT